MKNTVTLEFNGKDAEKIAECAYHLLVDGGLEDQIMDTVAEQCEVSIEPDGCDNENHITRFTVK
ncbi:hypothetical protein MKC73_12640 [[Clostridium] innocuum]|nr:hypothetical protein [[Clostridium] innocuum]